MIFEHFLSHLFRRHIIPSWFPSIVLIFSISYLTVCFSFWKRSPRTFRESTVSLRYDAAFLVSHSLPCVCLCECVLSFLSLSCVWNRNKKTRHFPQKFEQTSEKKLPSPSSRIPICPLSLNWCTFEQKKNIPSLISLSLNPYGYIYYTWILSHTIHIRFNVTTLLNVYISVSIFFRMINIASERTNEWDGRGELAGPRRVLLCMPFRNHPQHRIIPSPSFSPYSFALSFSLSCKLFVMDLGWK